MSRASIHMPKEAKDLSTKKKVMIRVALAALINLFS